MPHFRKRPVVIEAIQFTGTNPEQIADFAYGSIGYANTREVCIQTREGDMRGKVGDWVIRGVAGEFYLCDDSIFQATYEPVREASALAD